MFMCRKMRGYWQHSLSAAVLAIFVLQAAEAGAFAQKTRGAQRGHTELSPWAKAAQGRQALEGIPEANRTKADYTAALDGFRAIYHDTPGSSYAAAAVNAVAELLADEGRTLHDTKSLKAAVGQYEFLRTQYPGSSLRVSALLAEAQIYQNDLNDPATARERYSLFLKQYSHSSLAEEAQAGLDSLKPGAQHREPAAGGNQQASSARTSSLTADSSASMTSRLSNKTDLGAVAEKIPSSKDVLASSGKSGIAGPDESDRRGTAHPLDDDATVMAQPESTGLSHVASASTKRKGLAVVGGIRHWSTPTYTRVAIDLGDDVTYEAARVPHPDRIYFDLHGTRLAQELVGRNFTVTDDGFLKRIRAAQFSNDMTRVVLDVNDVTEYSAFLLPNPYRLIIDIHGSQPAQTTAKSQTTAGGEVPAPRTADATSKVSAGRPVPNTVVTKNSNTTTEVAALSEQPGKVDATSTPTSLPIAAVVPGSAVDSNAASTVSSSKTTTRKGKRGEPAQPARAAVPTADGQTSLVRALGLKIGRIVIDPGHGGHDSGTIGVDGLEEKDVVLDVALRLGKILHDRLGAEIIYTRSDDTFIPLETRTAIANKAQADLFLSIHANSSADASARGVETYYLNFTSQADALQVAARENAVSDQSIYQLSDLVKKIALKDKIDESREFAFNVETSLYSGLQRGNAGLKNRGVKKAPFVVLIGANMPSILSEISFVTNPKDANQLRQPEYRQRVAESLYKGVAKYAGGLSGAKPPTERASAK
jgi:N-acetylmuramoyl-L-alanine amidase